MKVNVKKVIAKFKIQTSLTINEAISSVFKNLLRDIKHLTYSKHIRVSQVIPFKPILITVKIEETERLIDEYNEALLEFFENYKDIWEDWQTKEDKKLVSLEAKKLESDFNKYLDDLRLLIENLIKDLNLLRTKHKLTISESNKINKFIKKLTMLSRINYRTFINDILSGKLPII